MAKPARTSPSATFSFDVSRCLICSAKNLNMCGALEQDELAKLSGLARCESFSSGDVLFHEGDPATTVYNITDGAVRLSTMLKNGRRQVIGFLFSGDFIGFSDRDAYPWTAEAVRGAKVCRFTRPDLAKAAKELPKIEHRLLEMASADLSAAQDHITMLGQGSAAEKLSAFLLMLSRKAADRGGTANPVHLPMTREDIADYLGLAFETVSRCFARLEGAGLISVESLRIIRITNFDALAEFSDSE
ncbi:MAG: Crp/Fnr family transcriptional regulator [Rhodospirillaceae bacterium]|nr:Crp/Fnr family transcriptional regulator [Rhodospirillaceae bacterium]